MVVDRCDWGLGEGELALLAALWIWGLGGEFVDGMDDMVDVILYRVTEVYKDRHSDIDTQKAGRESGVTFCFNKAACGKQD